MIGQESEARTIDVHQGNDGSSLKITRLIYSRLVETDSDMNTTWASWKLGTNKSNDYTISSKERIKIP